MSFLKSNKMFFCVCALFFLFFSGGAEVRAAQSVGMGDLPTTGGGMNEVATQDSGNIMTNLKSWFWEKAQKIEDYAWQEAASKAYHSALSSALNNIAYDTATWIGSGGEGQEPMFIREGWGAYLQNVAGGSAGAFIEKLGQGGAGEFNLCEPSGGITAKIGLGLVDHEAPDEPECTFTEMKDNWAQAVQSQDFLSNFQNMFNPESNDLGIALSLQQGMFETKQKETEYKRLQREEGGGWLDIRNIAGERESIPGLAEKRTEQAMDAQSQSFAESTGDAFVDAANIFLNQLALTAFNNLLSSLGSDQPNYTSSYSGDYGGFSNQQAQGSQSGIAGVEERFRQMAVPNFNERGSYEVLGELTQCPDPTEAGPTECVITDGFRKAISEKMTVAEAIEKGYLNGDAVFAYKSGNGLQPRYDEGYPYRSLIILRKYRIIPIGWELAGQYINSNFEEVGGVKSLNDMIDCYDQDESWCEGLVDPNWLLKAPENYCAREGPGPIIQTEKVVGEGEDSELNVSRKDDYCADEQTCIKKSNDGSCEYYGYCISERRQWDFEADSCEPKYNTCQTFKDPEGSSVSYLQNTLDYGICGPDNAGCGEYASDFVGIGYSTSTDSVSWNESDSPMYFDRDASECSSGQEGCHGFIRTAPGTDSNLLVDASFEEASGEWSGDGTIIEGDAYLGDFSLELGEGGLDKNISIDPEQGYSKQGEKYTFSFYAKNCNSGDKYGIVNSKEDLSSMEGGNDWQKYVYSHAFAEDESNEEIINIKIDSSSCIVDGLKLERGGSATDYVDYRQNGLIYEKMLPEYLYSDCYGSDYRYQDGAPDACYDFARRCNRDEVGCNRYTSDKDDFEITAKTSAQNVCPSECNGYDTYIQQENYFEDRKSKYFIPKTAQTCGANSAGCEEFTNLDKLGQGAEAVEYYSYLRQCVKPDEPGVDCAEFYTWQGDEEGERQLVYYTLESKESGNQDIPKPVKDNAGECNEDVYNASPMDDIYNPDCMKFYNQDGEAHYELHSNTISCSENCHPYRRTDSEDEGSCPYEDNNSIEWSDEHDACIYQAIPDEGVKCEAEDAGCRQYNGDQSGNMRLAAVYDFEGGTTQEWEGGENNDNSLVPEDNSFKITSDEASVDVSEKVSKGSSYTLRILARADDDVSGVNIYFDNGDETDEDKEIHFDVAVSDFEEPEDQASSIDIDSSDWKVYEVSWHNLTHDVTPEEELVIKGANEVYIDSARLMEMPDSYYLIKDSWQTPDSCHQNIYGETSLYYMLGCERYQDQNGESHYLHDFNEMCSETAVGCELMKDTRNSTDAGDDRFLYMTYDTGKECNKENKGCERFGELYEYTGERDLYQDVYLKNNPDEHDTIICSKEAVGCEEWGGENGYSYFKDPGNEVCEWKKPGENPWGWYKKEIKKCDNDGNGEVSADNPVCLSDSDCGEGDCITFTYEMADGYYDCPTDENGDPKTLGRGGERIVQPADDWTGLCPASQSGCTEYIDPYSESNPNLLDNSTTSPTTQVSIEPHSTYYWSENVGAEDNDALLKISPHVYHYYGDIYYGDDHDSVELSGDIFRKAIVDYRLAQEVNKTDCNGLYNFRDGCILFNERSVSGGDGSGGIEYKSKKWDSKKTHETYEENPSQGTPPETGSNGSNQLLKVRPDRTCDSWLACTTYTQDDQGERTCYNTGECSSLDEHGDCDRFQSRTLSGNITYTTDYVEAIKGLDLTGYYKAGYAGTDHHKVPNNLLPLGGMDQQGGSTEVANGNFELRSEENYPIGWTPLDDVAWEEDVFSVIDNPVRAQEEGVDYPVEGSNFLKYSAESYLSAPFSEYIEVEPGEEYVISAWVNTKNLKSSHGDHEVGMVLAVLGYNNEGTGQDGSISVENPEENVLDWDALVIDQNQGKGWNKQVAKFTVEESSDVTKLRVALASYGNTNGTDEICAKSGAGADYCLGNIYVDDIKIKPALEAKRQPEQYHIPQSCRLYPQNDSLSCEYYEDSGKKQKGQYGYCLEYDRDPGNSDACLLWWPVDMVEGQSKEEGAGYSGRFPLYYCTDIEKTTGAVKIYCQEDLGAGLGADCEWSASETREGPFGFDKNYMIYKVEGDYMGLDQPGNDLSVGWPSIRPCEAYSVYAAPSLDSEWSYLGDVGGKGVDGDACPHDGGLHHAYYDLGYAKDHPKRVGKNDYVDHNPYYAAVKYLKFVKYQENVETGGGSKDTPYPEFLNPGFFCSEIVQTVSPAGNNKYWSKRVNEGSEHSYTCNQGLGMNTTCSYLTDYKPYGSAVAPAETFAEAANPYLWDTKDDQEGKQPLYYKVPNKELAEPYQPRMGQLQDKEDLKRIFAKSYGVWRWESEGATLDGNYGHINAQVTYNNGRQLVLTDNEWYLADAAGNWQSPEDLGLADRDPKNYFNKFDNSEDHGPEGGYAAQHALSLDGLAVFFSSSRFYVLDTINDKWIDPSAEYGLADNEIKSLFESFDNPENAPSQNDYRYITSSIELTTDNQYWLFFDHNKMYSLNWDSGVWDPPVNIEDMFNGFNNSGEAPQDYSDITSATVEGPFAGSSQVSFFDRQYRYLLGADKWYSPDSLSAFFGGSSNAPQQTGRNYDEGGYVPQDGGGWGPPDNPCNGNGSTPRPEEYPHDWCGVTPKVENIKVNGTTTGATVDGTGFVNLTFNSKVDSQQLPLTSIYIDWGDDNITTISGAEMRDKSNEDDPHSFYHLYSYQDLKAKEIPTNTIRPKIRIKDNWGWCTGDSTRGECSDENAVEYSGSINVTD